MKPVDQPLSLAAAVRGVLALALAPAIGQGIGRFGYALVLPDMQADLDWSYAEAGWMNTINAAGYLAGALTAAAIVNRVGAWPSVWLGCLLGAVGIALCGVSSDFLVLSGVRFGLGVVAAWAFVGGATLSAAYAGRVERGTAFVVALYYIGPGLGIILSGMSAPSVLDSIGPGGWRETWYFLGALSLVLCIGLVFAGEARRSGGVMRGDGKRAPIRPMAIALTGYTMFGAGYIAYMTFMIAWVQQNGGGPLTQGAFWAAIGVGGAVSPFLWARLLDRATGGRAIALLIGITMTGSIGPLVSTSFVALLLSAFVFGSAFFSVVAATTVFIRRNYDSTQWASGIGAMTIAFGLGQTIGPVAIGAITDIVGGLGAGLTVSALVLGLGVVISLAQGDLRDLRDLRDGGDRRR